MNYDLVIYIGNSAWVPIYFGSGKTRKNGLWRNIKTDEHIAHAYMLKHLDEWCRQHRSAPQRPTKVI